MFKCYECDEVFAEPKVYREKMGEYWGMPAYDTFTCCPHCDGSFDFAVRCRECGEFFFDEDLTDGRCEHCIEEILYQHRFDVKACYDILKDETESIELNPALTMLLNRDEIEQILLNALMEADADCLPIIEEYEDWILENNGGDDE